MPSTISGDDNFNSKDVNIGAAKAWVNFNGTFTISITESFNVSSLTDNGLGDYSVNLTTPITIGSAVVGGQFASPLGTTSYIVEAKMNTTSQITVISKSISATLGANYDGADIQVLAFSD